MLRHPVLFPAPGPGRLTARPPHHPEQESGRIFHGEIWPAPQQKLTNTDVGTAPRESNQMIKLAQHALFRCLSFQATLYSLPFKSVVEAQARISGNWRKTSNMKDADQNKQKKGIPYEMRPKREKRQNQSKTPPNPHNSDSLTEKRNYKCEIRKDCYKREPRWIKNSQRTR